MKMNDAKSFIKNLASKNVHIPPLLVGSMGIGKSNIVKQVAQELNIELIDLRLAQQEPGDLIGIPRVHDGVTVWAKPEWWPKEGTRGILFLDEINRAAPDVRQAVFQLINEWRMHTHVLPDGWLIVSAMNPENGTYQVEPLDPAMIRRFCLLKVTADVDVWLKWAHGPGAIDSTITSFVGAHRDMLLGIDDAIPMKAIPTPDQYRMLDTLIKSNVVPHELEMEVFTGLIGTEAAVAYRRYLDANYNRPVTGEEILDNYAKIKKKLMKQKNDEMFITVNDLTAKLDSVKKVTDEQKVALYEFIKDIPAEFKTTFVLKLPKHLLADIVANKDLAALVANVVKESRK